MAYAGKTAINHAVSGQRQTTKGLQDGSLRKSRRSLGEEDNPEKSSMSRAEV